MLPLDFAFNNAGVDAENQALTEQSEETFDRIMSINVKGAWLCLKHEVTQMLRNGGGAIVNTTSGGDSILSDFLARLSTLPVNMPF
jgi:NAD(P)-dependent dehydrogenase (short-subunit alcohol dehydrogenase family)